MPPEARLAHRMESPGGAVVLDPPLSPPTSPAPDPGTAGAPAPTVRRGWWAARRVLALVVASDVAAILVAAVVTLHLGLGRGDRLGLAPWQAVGAIVPVVVAAFAHAGLYRARLLVGPLDELRRVLHGVVGGTLGVAAMGYLGGSEVASGWLVLLSGLTLAVVGVERLLLRGAFSQVRRRGRLLRRVVLVGDGPEAVALASELGRHPEIGYEVADVLPSAGPPGEDPVAPVLAALDRHGATGAIIVPHGLAPTVSTVLVDALVDAGHHVEVSCSMEGVAAPRLTVRPLGTTPVMYVERPSRGGWRRVGKRAFDVVVAAALAVVTLPVVLAAALSIRLDSPGPVIFRQQRVGRDGEPIEMLKLRTMVVDAEARLPEVLAANEAAGPLFKLADDPRVTRVGRVLRQLSVDELPQLWNVLRGDMSLVGPRPALPHETAAWSADLHRRLEVAPGITGMWQVMGRADVGHGDYARYDLFYVRNWSLWTDLVILGKTVPAVLSRRGAC